MQYQNEFKNNNIIINEDSMNKALNTIIEVAEPDKIILFGSRAKNNYNSDSDFDFLVLKKEINNERALAQKIYLQFKNIGASVDIIVSSLNKYEEHKNDPYLIYHEINENGKVVYEKN